MIDVEENDSLDVARGPTLTPVIDPHELKDRTLRDYTRNAGVMGMPTDAADIERLVLADLQLADGFKRDEKPLREAKKESAEERAERHRRTGEQIAGLTDATVIYDQRPQEWGPRLDLPKDIGLSEKWMLAKGRMLRVMEGASLPIKHPDGTLDFKSMTATCGYPQGAYDYLSHWFSLDMRNVFETRNHNPYFGMSHRDASLKFVAETMNICDRSSGRFGPWLVPK